MKPTALLVAFLLAAAPAAALAAPAPDSASQPAPATATQRKNKPPAMPAAKGRVAPKPPPEHVRHNNRGADLLGGGQTAEAIKAFQQALKLKPDYVIARVNLGLAYLEAKRPEEATKQFTAVLEKSPKMLTAMDGLAMAYAAQGKYEEAIAQERKALEVRPNYANAYYNIGCWQAVQKKTEEAFASVERAVELGYRDAKWMEQDADLSGLHADQDRWRRLIEEASKPAPKPKMPAHLRHQPMMAPAATKPAPPAKK